MKNSLKINDGTLKLLYILAGVILLAVAWFAVVQNINDKNKVLKKENEELTVQVERLREMEAVKDKYIENTDAMELAIDEMLDGVPSKVLDDDKANIATRLRDSYNIEVIAQNDVDDESIYHMGEKYKNSEDSGKILMKSPYVLRCKVSYNDLKNCLDQFKAISEKRVLSIEEIKVTYDDNVTDGDDKRLLIASISINMYYLEGSDKPYEPLESETIVPIGNPNLFNAE